jgi:hypothetical protein
MPEVKQAVTGQQHYNLDLWAELPEKIFSYKYESDFH